MRSALWLRTLPAVLLVFLCLPGSALALDAVLVIPGTPGNSYSGSIGGPGSSIGSSVLAFEAFGGTDNVPGGQTMTTYSGTFRLVKVTDDATVPLISNAMIGDLVSFLEIRAVVGSATITYEFSNVIINAVNTTGSLDDPVDEIEFSPCAVRISSTSAGSGAPAEWNFSQSLPEYPGTCLQ